MDSPKNPLLGRFDVDPGRWRPMWYGVEIDVPVLLNGRGVGSISLNNQPFIATRLTHQVIGDTAHASSSGLFQDGMYTIAFKDEQSNYINQPIPSECFAGSVVGGFSYEFPYPLPYAGSKTVTFEVYNRVLRTLDPESDYFTVAIVLHGIADWGTVRQS